MRAVSRTRGVTSRLGVLGVVAATLAPAAGVPGDRTGVAGVHSPDPSIVRTVRLGFNPVSVLADQAAGRVLVFGYNPSGSVVALLDAATGMRVRALHLGRQRFIPPEDGDPAAIDPVTGRVYLPTATASQADGPPDGPCVVRVLDGRTGATIQLIRAGYTPAGVALAARAPRLFVADNPRTDAAGRAIDAGGTRLIDLATARLVRTLPDGAPLAVDERTGRVFLASSVGLDVRDAATGRSVARVPFGGSDSIAPDAPVALAVDERAGRVVVALSSNSGLSGGAVLDARIGRIVTQAAPVGSGPLAVDAGTGRALSVDLPLSSTGGAVTATTFATRDGRAVHTVTLDTVSSRGVAAAVVIDAHSGHALVAWERVNGAVLTPTLITIVDLHSGRPVHSFALDDQPSAVDTFGPPAMAIDGRTRRAFATNYGASTVSVLDTTRL